MEFQHKCLFDRAPEGTSDDGVEPWDGMVSCPLGGTFDGSKCTPNFKDIGVEYLWVCRGMGNLDGNLDAIRR